MGVAIYVARLNSAVSQEWIDGLKNELMDWVDFDLDDTNSWKL